MPLFDLDLPQSKKNTGMAFVAHASITSKDLCQVCLVKKNLPFFVPLTNILTPHQSCLTVVEGEPSSVEFLEVKVQDFMEMFDQERENDKSVEDFYTLSGTTVKFQRFDVPIEGLPLLEKILSKHLLGSKCLEQLANREHKLVQIQILEFIGFIR